MRQRERRLLKNSSSSLNQSSMSLFWLFKPHSLLCSHLRRSCISFLLNLEETNLVGVFVCQMLQFVRLSDSQRFQRCGVLILQFVLILMPRWMRAGYVKHPPYAVMSLRHETLVTQSEQAFISALLCFTSLSHILCLSGLKAECPLVNFWAVNPYLSHWQPVWGWLVLFVLVNNNRVQGPAFPAQQDCRVIAAVNKLSSLLESLSTSLLALATQAERCACCLCQSSSWLRSE